MKTMAEEYANKCCDGRGCKICKPELYVEVKCLDCDIEFSQWQLENGRCSVCNKKWEAKRDGN